MDSERSNQDSGLWARIWTREVAPGPFIVIRSRGPKWDDARPLEGQMGWREHADFMDALFMEDFVTFAGPLEGTRDALLIVRARDEAEITSRLAADPWTENGLLTLKDCWPWQLRLGTLGE